ncbi:MAG TPA: hypothetical protein PLO56_00110 [Rhodothermales bacterium]|nr:hypothetical protein [Rhodothermales bacterium]
MKRLFTTFTLVLVLLLTLGLTLFKRHDVHASYAKMAIEGKKAYLSIRVFSDDITLALQQFHKDPSITLKYNEETMRSFQKYLNWKFIIKKNGKQISGKIIEVYEQDIMTVFVAEYSASQPIHRFDLEYIVLMEVFDDQRNVLKLIKLPNDTEQSLFFGAGVRHQTVIL